MAYNFDPRGDLPPPLIRPTSYISRSADTLREHRRRSAQAVSAGQKSRKHRRACYDWIFSSASNVHIATDKTSFKTYTTFKSYVLTLGDQRQVPVLGIGTVVINIKRQPGSKDGHSVTLENVLHVPSWMCNVFSDIYFEPATAFEHTWTDFGVTFMKKKDDGTLRYWGFTEDFCGLERLVLAKELHGRSPMLEDKDREIFSVNVTWPQGQRDQYAAYLQTEGGKQSKMEAKPKDIDGNAVRRSTQVERNGKF
jgi:hypothetical protein